MEKSVKNRWHKFQWFNIKVQCIDNNTAELKQWTMILSIFNYFLNFWCVVQIGQERMSSNLALFFWNNIKIQPLYASTNYFLHVLQQSFSVMLKKEWHVCVQYRPFYNSLFGTRSFWTTRYINQFIFSISSQQLFLRCVTLQEIVYLECNFISS